MRPELVNSLVYISKLPSKGKRTVLHGARTKQEPCKVSLRTRLHLFNEMKKHKVFDYWLAGGEGSRILREAKSVALGKRSSNKPAPATVGTRPRRKPMYRQTTELPPDWYV